MQLFKKITANIVFALQVLIAFVLIFENSIQVPALIQSFGRMHPLLLHLPIGLLIATAILIFTRRFFEGPGFEELISFLLHLTAFTASLTTLMGLFLSLEGGYEESILNSHKWLGVSLSFLCWALIIQKNIATVKFTMIASVVLVIVTGHFGATLTHGEQTVLEPLFTSEKSIRVITDSSTVFSAAIEPVLEAKCYSCHNESKSKGKLVLTSEQGLLRGGKTGKLFEAGNAEKSLMIERLYLPLHEKKHMPPRDKAQLTEDELAVITAWIDHGADFDVKLANLSKGDTLRKMSDLIIARYSDNQERAQTYTFEFVSNDKVRKLNIPNRSVFQIARNEPALEADFYLRESYDKKYLDELRAVRNQIIALNLSNMPVEDSELEIVASFENLEKLILNNTQVKGGTLNLLARLQNLKLLSLSGTDVSFRELERLKDCKSLKDVFIWDTRISSDELSQLMTELPTITWHSGYAPDANEILKLNAPLLKNDGNVLAAEDEILLKHNLPGTTIRFSVGEKDPDSVNSPVYKDGISIDGYTVVKAKVFKDGWKSSDVVEYVFFKKGITPLRAELLSKAEAKYEGAGINTLVDGQKGMPDFYKDPSWIGFRNEPLDARFFFDGSAIIKSVTLSYARNVWAMCMPPFEVEVWGGDDEQNLKSLGEIKPPQPNGWVSGRTEGVSISISPATYRCLKIVAKPLAKLPEFRNEKKQKGWLMADEIYFN